MTAALKLDWLDAVTHATEAAASLREFRRIGHSSVECLDGRAADLSTRARCEITAYHQLGLSAISRVVTDAARAEPDEHRKKLLLAGADAIDAIHEADERSKPERLIGFSTNGHHSTRSRF